MYTRLNSSHNTYYCRQVDFDLKSKIRLDNDQNSLLTQDILTLLLTRPLYI